MFLFIILFTDSYIDLTHNNTTMSPDEYPDGYLINFPSTFGEKDDAESSPEVNQYIKDFDSLPTETILDEIRQGKFVATHAVAILVRRRGQELDDNLIKGGLITIVLDHLKQCKDKSVAEVLMVKDEHALLVEGGYVTSPRVWLDLLSSIMSMSANADTTDPVLEVDIIHSILAFASSKHVVSSKEDFYGICNAIYKLLCIHTCIQEDGWRPNPDHVMYANLAGPDDHRFACAIKGGLFETCLELLIRFKGTEDDELVVNHLKCILSGANACQFHYESSAAIGDAYDEILNAIKKPDVRNLENAKYWPLPAMILQALGCNQKSFGVSTDGQGFIICRGCNNKLEEGGVFKGKRCSGCKKVTYCNEKCQKDDWRRHKKECKLIAKKREELTCDKKHHAFDDGLFTTPAALAKVHTDNTLAAAESIMHVAVNDLLMDATHQGWDILDCMVLFDFRTYGTPLKPKPMLHEEFLDSKEYGMASNHPAREQFKGQMMKYKSAGGIMVLCISTPPLDKPLPRGKCMVSMTPFGFTCGSPEGSWPALQKKLAERANIEVTFF